MASRNSRWWRGEELISWAAVPRPMTRLTLLLIGVALGWAAWACLPPALVAYVSGAAGSLCLLVAAAVWGMRDKADLAFESPHLSTEELRTAMAASQHVRRRSMKLSAWAALMAVIASSSATSLQLAGSIWLFMPLLGGAAVGENLYCYLIANAWDTQLRAIRERNAIEARGLAEREQLAERIKASMKEPRAPLSGWRVSSTTDTLRKPTSSH